MADAKSAAVTTVAAACAVRVRVIMPAYNSESFIAAAIESIIKQGMKDFELIIVDDGSTDRTPDIIKSHAAAATTVGRIRVLTHSTNRGLVAALTTGLDAALAASRIDACPYIARMDSDDIASADRFAVQCAFLDANPALALAGSAVTIFSDAEPDRTRVITNPASPARVYWSLHFYCCIAHPTVMLRTEAVSLFIARNSPAPSTAAAATAASAPSLYRSDFAPAEDYDCWLRLCRSAAPSATVSTPFQCGNVPQSLLSLRKHGSNVSSQSAVKQKQQTVRALSAHLHALWPNEPASSAPTTVAASASVPATAAAAVSTSMELIARGLLYPASITSADVLCSVFDWILRIETRALALPYATPSDREWIATDATARLGEVVLASMKIDASAKHVQSCWSQWMARQSTAGGVNPLALLLGGGNRNSAVASAKSSDKKSASAQAAASLASTGAAAAGSITFSTKAEPSSVLEID